jgi:hypothetical protein
MPEKIQYEDDELFNPETHHEHSDVPVRPLWWAIIIFVVFAILSHIALWFLYKAFVKGERNRAEAPQTVVSRPDDLHVPRDQPLLQPFPRVTEDGTPLPPNLDTPVTDLDRMLRDEEAVLGSYGWVSQQNGVVRIPIEEAKAILAARLAVQGQIAGTLREIPETTTAPVDGASASPAIEAPSPADSAPPAEETQPQATTTGGSE